MRYFFGFFFLLMSIAGCKQKATLSDRAQLENDLKKTMNEYLQKNNAKPGISFTVTDVIFFDEKNSHTCIFDVTMHYANKDTIGKMKAIISNDFSSVKRIY
jgi:hypothetical protein